MNEQIKTYGLRGEWILASLSYNDALELTTRANGSGATLNATFTGTLRDALAVAPELGSRSELLPEKLRCHKRSFSQGVNTVTATLSYAEFEDEDAGATYSLSATPQSIPLLQHRRFRGKNISDAARLLTQEYLNGGTDSTAIFYKEENGNPVFADAVPAAELSLWTQKTLKELAEKYAPEGTREHAVVSLARKGVKALPAPALTWTEVRTSKFKPAVEGIGERASPRGDNPTGHRWILASVRATEEKGSDGETRYKINTEWRSDDYPKEED